MSDDSDLENLFQDLSQKISFGSARPKPTKAKKKATKNTPKTAVHGGLKEWAYEDYTVSPLGVVLSQISQPGTCDEDDHHKSSVKAAIKSKPKVTKTKENKQPNIVMEDDLDLDAILPAPKQSTTKKSKIYKTRVSSKKLLKIGAESLKSPPTSTKQDEPPKAPNNIDLDLDFLPDVKSSSKTEKLRKTKLPAKGPKKHKPSKESLPIEDGFRPDDTNIFSSTARDSLTLNDTVCSIRSVLSQPSADLDFEIDSDLDEIPLKKTNPKQKSKKKPQPSDVIDDLDLPCIMPVSSQRKSVKKGVKSKKKAQNGTPIVQSTNISAIKSPNEVYNINSISSCSSDSANSTNLGGSYEIEKKYEKVDVQVEEVIPDTQQTSMSDRNDSDGSVKLGNQNYVIPDSQEPAIDGDDGAVIPDSQNVIEIVQLNTLMVPDTENIDECMTDDADTDNAAEPDTDIIVPDSEMVPINNNKSGSAEKFVPEIVQLNPLMLVQDSENIDDLMTDDSACGDEDNGNGRPHETTVPDTQNLLTEDEDENHPIDKKELNHKKLEKDNVQNDHKDQNIQHVNIKANAAHTPPSSRNIDNFISESRSECFKSPNIALVKDLDNNRRVSINTIDVTTIASTANLKHVMNVKRTGGIHDETLNRHFQGKGNKQPFENILSVEDTQTSDADDSENLPVPDNIVLDTQMDDFQIPEFSEIPKNSENLCIAETQFSDDEIANAKIGGQFICPETQDMDEDTNDSRPSFASEASLDINEFIKRGKTRPSFASEASLDINEFIKRGKTKHDTVPDSMDIDDVIQNVEKSIDSVAMKTVIHRPMPQYSPHADYNADLDSSLESSKSCTILRRKKHHHSLNRTKGTPRQTEANSAVKVGIRVKQENERNPVARDSDSDSDDVIELPHSRSITKFPVPETVDVGDSNSEDSDVTVDDFSRNVSICSEGLLSEDDDNPVIENIKSPNVSTRKVPLDPNESQLSRHSMGLQVSMTSNDTHNASDTADDTENSHNASGLTNSKNRTAQSEDGINDEKSIGLQCSVESNPEDDDTQDKHENNKVKHNINQSDDESFFSAASDYNDDTGKEKLYAENSISQHSIGLQASMETIETSDNETNDHIQQDNVDVPDKHSIGLQASFESSENEEEYGAPQSKNSAGIQKRKNSKVKSAIESNTVKHTSIGNHARENSNKKPITDESNLDEDIINLSGIMTSKLKINHEEKLNGQIISDDDDFLPTQKSSKKSKSKKATIKAKIDELMNLDLDSDDLDLDSVLPIPKSTAKTKKGKKPNKKSTKKTEETNNYMDPKINKTSKKSKTSKLQIDLDISDSVDICPSQHTVTDGPEKSKKSKTPKLHIDLDISDYDDDPEISKVPEPIVNSSKKRSKDLPVHSPVDSIQSNEDELPDVSTSPHPSFSQPRVDIVSLLSDSSEDDDAMENFFSKMKTPGKSQVQPSYNDDNNDDYDDNDDNDFIVPDDMVSSSESDDSLFYKKSLVDTPASRPKKSSHKYNTSSEDSDISTPGSYRPKTTSTTSNDTSVFSTPGSSKPNRNTSTGSQDTSNEVLGVSTPHSYFKTPKLPGKTPKSAGTPHIDSTDLGRSLTDRLFKTKVSGTLNSLTKPTVKSKPTVPQSTGVINKTKKVVPEVVRSRSSEYRPSTYSFLKSLSTNIENQRRHPDALEYVKQFKKKKEELTMRLVKLYNETVFDSKLPENLEVIWNPRLLKTAGYCAYKRNRVKQDDRTCRIELSGKVCDSSERVRDTLIHEMCHAAVWLLNGVNDGHGRFWKYWARKSNIAHPELPIIQRCHSYEINTKFTYKCVECGYQIGRHSKSLDTTKKVCGYCHGQFELIVNNKDGTPRKPRAPSTPNKFALFVKDNYGKQKQLNKGAPHKDIMNILSAEFASKSSI